MPPWSPVEASVDVVCRLHQRINDVYDVNQIDVVVVGIFHQVRIFKHGARLACEVRIFGYGLVIVCSADAY